MRTPCVTFAVYFLPLLCILHMHVLLWYGMVWYRGMVQGPSRDLRRRGGRGGRLYRDGALREHPVHQLADGALEAPPAQGARGLAEDRMEVGHVVILHVMYILALLALLVLRLAVSELDGSQRMAF